MYAMRTNVGMGNLVTRSIRAVAYMSLPSVTRNDMETTIRRLPSYAAALNGYYDILERARRERGNPQAIAEFEAKVQDLHGSFNVVNDQVRAAAKAAQDDGHPIRIDGNNVGMGLAPLVAAVVVVLGAVAIVASYWAITRITIGVASVASNFAAQIASINALFSAKRADLIPSLGRPNPVDTGGSGGSSSGGFLDGLGKGVGGVAAIAAIGMGIWAFTRRKR